MEKPAGAVPTIVAVDAFKKFKCQGYTLAIKSNMRGKKSGVNSTDEQSTPKDRLGFCYAGGRHGKEQRHFQFSS